MAGYSGTPLARKLGITDGARVRLLGAPAGVIELLAPLPPGAVVVPDGPADVAVCFATRAADLAAEFVEVSPATGADGAIWAAWPKRASKVPTDITEDRLREMFLPTGLVDVKVCAIDETWSGLRFVVRKELRTSWAGLPA